MSSEPPHSSSLRKGRYSSPDAVYFITSNVLNREPLLTPPARDILIASLKWLSQAKRLRLVGYVIMDNRFHALLTLLAGTTLPAVMHSLRRHSARQINLLQGRVGELWQAGYHDHVIRDAPDFWQHVRYMAENPVRRGWVSQADEYAWSTAHPSRRQDVDWGAVGYQPN